MIFLHGVSKMYRGAARRTVLSAISCVLPSRASVAILGQRQSGKTTLIRLLSGMATPTEGYIERRESVSFPIGFDGRLANLTGSGLLGLTARTYGVPVDQLFEFVTECADLKQLIHMPMRTMPPVARRQLLYAMGYAIPFGWYLFDGVIGVGPSDFYAKCRQLYEVRRKQAGMIVATSSPLLARECCDSGAVLYRGRLTLFHDVEDAVAVFSQLPAETPIPEESALAASESEADEQEPLFRL